MNKRGGQIKHGCSTPETPTYRAWMAMKRRCYNRNQAKYPNYGGRGIQVCLRWFDFRNFLSDMGEKPRSELTLDRIDNDLHYMPGNCRWAMPKQQANNRRPNYRSMFATINGETKLLVDWEKIAGLTRQLIYSRRRRGWKDEDLLKPPRYNKHWHKR